MIYDVTGELLGKVKTLLGIAETDTSEDNLIRVYLEAAAHEILSWRYSYSAEDVWTVPEEYTMTQVFAVVAGYSMNGAEGQMSHSENGISRTFRYPDMIAYIHAHVIPKCKVV